LDIVLTPERRTISHNDYLNKTVSKDNHTADTTLINLIGTLDLTQCLKREARKVRLA
jgi:hypothetical protein